MVRTFLFYWIACLLWITLDAHVVDIHIKTPSEIAEEERQDKQREIDRDREIFEDEDRSDEERRRALGRLNENEEIV